MYYTRVKKILEKLPDHSVSVIIVLAAVGCVPRCNGLRWRRDIDDDEES